MNHLLTFIFLIFIFYFYWLIGEFVADCFAIKIKNSTAYVIYGFISVFFISFIIGFPCQLFQLSWNVYFILFCVLFFSFFVFFLTDSLMFSVLIFGYARIIRFCIRTVMALPKFSDTFCIFSLSCMILRSLIFSCKIAITEPRKSIPIRIYAMIRIILPIKCGICFKICRIRGLANFIITTIAAPKISRCQIPKYPSY